MPEPFTLLAEDLDHPEGVAWNPFDGHVYAGGEAGQVYRVSLDGEVEKVGDTGGEILGVTLDGSGRIYVCDCGRCQIVRLDTRDGSVEVYSAGVPGQAIHEPNYAAFDAAGNLYVTDSGETKEDNGCILRIGPGGETVVWSRELPRYPNGCCLGADGRALLVAESYLPGVSRIPILADGSAGRPEVLVELPGTVPDGVALDSSGDLYVACYRPDRIYRVSPSGAVEVLADDPQGIDLNAPTNVAFAGSDLRQMVVANVGEVHLLIGDVGAAGLPLNYPEVP
jgi:sugar lactone lactonase YvrE